MLNEEKAGKGHTVLYCIPYCFIIGKEKTHASHLLGMPRAGVDIGIFLQVWEPR
jgi:hypothetical protein